MSKIANIIRKSTFLKHNAIFFFGALAAGALNYLFYPIMARLLDTSSFGEVQALFSLFAQINIFLGVLGLLTVNIVVNNPKSQQRDQLIIELEKLVLLVGLVLMVMSLFFGHALERFFHFNSIWPFVVLSAALFVTVPLTFRTAFLRGKRAFAVVSIVNIAAAGADLVLSVAFVLLGWKTTGVMAGLVVAQLLTCIYAAWLARSRGFGGSQARALFKLPDMRMIAPELRYAALVLVCSLIVTGMYSIDTVLAKHWFDAHTAGLYAGIAAIARIIFFVTASISQVLLPSVRLDQPAHRNRQILAKSFVLLAGIGGGVLLVFSLLPQLVIRVLMGQSFLPLADLLPRLSLVVFLISIINLFVLYHLALRRYAIGITAVLGACATAVFVGLNHQTPIALVNDLLYGSIITAMLLGAWVVSTGVRAKVAAEQSEILP